MTILVPKQRRPSALHPSLVAEFHLPTSESLRRHRQLLRLLRRLLKILIVFVFVVVVVAVSRTFHFLVARIFLASNGPSPDRAPISDEEEDG